MKFKKLIYILLILFLFPCYAQAEDYPFLPTTLKEKVISAFDINTAGKTMLYEKVNIYEDFDAWMIGWFDNKTKIIAGITDTEDIIYYNISGLGDSVLSGSGKGISLQEGEKIALNFLTDIMPRAELKLVSSKAFEYTFTDSYHSIPILGRTATVVVDKLSGNVMFYKGFGQTACNFLTLTEGLITPEHAFEKFYENIGLELVYNTVFDHSSRSKAVRPMYILNRSDFKAVNAQNGKIANISMQDYNYYYNDDFFNPNYYYDNNIFTDEALFTPDGSVSASDYKISSLLNTAGLNLSDGYCAKVVPGKLSYYRSADGTENSRDILRVDVVPVSHAIDIYKFCDKFDSGNLEWFNTLSCETPFVFARAYVDPVSGRILDFETVKNSFFLTSDFKNLPYADIEKFVHNSADEKNLQFYGAQPVSDEITHLTYARYENEARVIGEGASVKYDHTLGCITDYTLSISDTKFLSTSFMKTHEQMKDFAKKELALGMFYVDKNEHSKFVVYDAINKSIAFDPVTGERIDRLDSESPVIAVLRVGDSNYTLNGKTFSSASPVISSGKLFVPVNVITTALGYGIDYSDQMLVISNGKDIINLSPGNTECLLNGEKIFLDASPIIIEENAYISAGSIRRLFGMFVSWDTVSGKIYLIK